MSRNLCDGAVCRQCGQDVFRTGEWKRGRDFQQIADFPYREYDDVMFCHARCCECGTPYLGWGHYPGKPNGFDGSIIDLSYRHSFNDEPSPDDRPLVRGRSSNEKRADALRFEIMARRKESE